jgi:hypothetical protein
MKLRRCKAAGVLKWRPLEEDEGDEVGGATPRLLRLTMDGSFDGTLGSYPVHQDRPHHGARLIDLGAAVPVPKPIVRMIRSIDCWLL